MSEEFRAKLIAAFPETTWPTLTRGIREAIKVADSVRRSTPFLSTLVGRDLRGLSRRAAVMWRVQLLCKSGELPFKAEEIQNTNGTSHLLSIRSQNIELHIVRTDEADAFPVDAPIRQDARASNSGDLFEDRKLLPLHKVLDSVPLYGWLAWGATGRGEITHLCLGMPEYRQDQWLALVNVLKHVSALEKTTKPTEAAASAPNPALLLKFREEIARSLEKEAGAVNDNG